LNTLYIYLFRFLIPCECVIWERNKGIEFLAEELVELIAYYSVQEINLDVTDSQWQSLCTWKGSVTVETRLAIAMEAAWSNLPRQLKICERELSGTLPAFLKLFYVSPARGHKIALEFYRAF
jgi:hypothetical protein